MPMGVWDDVWADVWGPVWSTDVPTVISMTIQENGSQLAMALTEAIQIGVGGSGGFTVTASGGAVTATFDQILSTVVWFDLSRDIEQGEVVTATYVQPGDGIEATSGGADLGSFSDVAVTNNSGIGTGSGGRRSPTSRNSRSLGRFRG